MQAGFDTRRRVLRAGAAAALCCARAHMMRGGGAGHGCGAAHAAGGDAGGGAAGGATAAAAPAPAPASAAAAPLRAASCTFCAASACVRMHGVRYAHRYAQQASRTHRIVRRTMRSAASRPAAWSALCAASRLVSCAARARQRVSARPQSSGTAAKERSSKLLNWSARLELI
jgi:hypothetical protein